MAAHCQEIYSILTKDLYCRPPQPRPLDKAIHADKPNEVMHWDYLYMGKSDSYLEYVLVIKDDTSKFVWLMPTDAATADNTFECLMRWFAMFGVVRWWVSDQGTHFKNKVLEGLQHALGAHRHFTTARCTWTNGTVEVVNREVLRCCRALLSEWRLQSGEWPRVIKNFQMVLNHSPCSAIDGVAPVTAMTGLKVMDPTDPLAVPDPIQVATLDDFQRRKHHNGIKGTTMAQFDMGDFVLYADVWQYARAKLRVKWCGPAQVTAAASNGIFEIENLISGERREVHAGRLKFYTDSSLEVTEDLLRHVAHTSATSLTRF
ncbi:Chromodomain containing hypothetical protein putative [Phytophthora palmivora]|uniref:Integrase catalytic domain-containing protein n=1 Tax=Phytophthora palmivora TaxID=4796 RepID=A0A2P4XGX1_9STRA|nr:Chromodomain containing hypothetical protein putative [Phytophthora palmivora]